MEQPPSYTLELKMNPEAERIMARITANLEKITSLLAENKGLMLKYFEYTERSPFQATLEKV